MAAAAAGGGSDGSTLYFTEPSETARRRADGLVVYLPLSRLGAVVWTVICELTIDFLLMLVELRSHNLPGDVGEV